MRITKDQGITLIALVITIIVLLILAGVALATLTGNTSIIDNANYAVGEYNKSANADQNVISDVENLFAKYMGNSQSSSGNSGETHRITYNANGGTGTMNEETAAVTGTSTFTPPEGKVFKEWNTSADGSGTSYAAGAAVPSDVILYAIWATEVIQQQYGNLVNEQTDTINQDYFTWEVITEPGVARYTPNSGTDGIVSRGDTPVVQKGTAKITGINWAHFGIQAVEYVNYYHYTLLTITTLEKKQEVESALRKLIIPYEVTKTENNITKTYTITQIDADGKADGEWLGFLVRDHSTAPNGYYSPIFATGSEYSMTSLLPNGVATDADTSYMIIPASVTSIEYIGLLPRDYIMFAPNNPIQDIEYTMFNGIFARFVKGLIFSNSVKSIEVRELDWLENIELNNGLIEIKELACCERLQNISIPETVTSIASFALEGNTSLININIPSGITIINELAFEDCDSLQKISIPSGVTIIGERAFNSCDSLAKVYIPRSVTTIGKSAFAKIFGENVTPYSVPITIYYGGTEQEWAAITKGTDVFKNRTVTMVYESDGIPEE